MSRNIVLVLCCVSIHACFAVVGPPPAGPFEVSSGSYKLPKGFLCGVDAQCNIWYPTQLDKGPFPIASFGHGSGNGNFGNLIQSVASLGIVVVKAATGNCNDHWRDILGALDWSQGNQSSKLHEALDHVDWSRQGVFGHSFGSAHAMAAAAYAAEHPGKWNIKALVASHGASDGAAPNLTMPSMFCSGGEDRRSKNRHAFNACPAKHKVFAEVNGARHMEPTHAGRLNPFDAHFLGCHIANLTTSCEKIYGNAPDSICHAGEALNYTMKSCDIVQPSAPLVMV